MNSTEWISGVYWTYISLCQSVQWKWGTLLLLPTHALLKKDENALILQCRLYVTLYSTRMLRNVKGKRTISNISRWYLCKPLWIPLCKGRRYSFLVLFILDEWYVSVYLNYHLTKSLEYCLLTVTWFVAGGSTRQIAPSECVGTKVKKKKKSHEREINIFMNRLVYFIILFYCLLYNFVYIFISCFHSCYICISTLHAACGTQIIFSYILIFMPSCVLQCPLCSLFFCGWGLYFDSSVL